ncbi:MAG: histidine kinase [Lachnospiraceae bacterium]|nr:histidine kinase [Lachnospiraceae bacterium]
MILRIIVPILALTVFAAMLLLFLVIYVDREREFLESRRELSESRAAVLQKEQELDRSRMAIMLSQIQPHFLYNTLTAIQTMCHGKAPEAEESIVQFSHFLRGNLDALSQSDPIPFRSELAHTQNYLNLEIKRFGENTLHIKYSIESEDFRIPTLTLQPLVENAVRYGVMQREEGGTVWISSVERSDSFVVTVRDDGAGFDVNVPKADGRTHIGINNVRNRLEKMCGGTLVITSVPDKGTTAVITIPKNESLSAV